MLHECLLALSGVPGDVFIESKGLLKVDAEDSTKIPDMYKDCLNSSFILNSEINFLSKSETFLLHEISDYASAFKLCESFSNSALSQVLGQDETSVNLFINAIGKSIDEVLRAFLTVLCEIELECLGCLSLGVPHLIQCIRVRGSPLLCTASIVKHIISNNLSGISILAYIWSGHELCADPKLKPMWKFHLKRVGAVFTNQLLYWLFDGHLLKNGSEFLVKKTDSLLSSRLDNTLKSTSANSMFLLKELSLPSSESPWSFLFRRTLHELSNTRNTQICTENVQLLIDVNLWSVSYADSLAQELLDAGFIASVLSRSGRDQALTRIEAASRRLLFIFDTPETASVMLRSILSTACQVAQEEWMYLTSSCAMGAYLRSCKDFFFCGNGAFYSSLLKNGFPFNDSNKEGIFNFSRGSFSIENILNRGIVNKSMKNGVKQPLAIGRGVSTGLLEVGSNFLIWEEQVENLPRVSGVLNRSTEKTFKASNVASRNVNGFFVSEKDAAKGSLENVGELYKIRFFRTSMMWQLDFKNPRNAGLGDTDLFVSRGRDATRMHWEAGSRIPSLVGEGSQMFVADAFDVSSGFEHTVGVLLVQNESSNMKNDTQAALSSYGSRILWVMQGSQSPMESPSEIEAGANILTESFGVDVRVMQTRKGTHWQADVSVLGFHDGDASPIVLKNVARSCESEGWQLQGYELRIRFPATDRCEQEGCIISVYARATRNYEGLGTVHSLFDNAKMKANNELFLMVQLQLKLDIFNQLYFPEGLAWMGLIPISIHAKHNMSPFITQNTFSPSDLVPVITFWSHNGVTSPFAAANHLAHKEVRNLVPPPENSSFTFLSQCEQKVNVRLAFAPRQWPISLLFDQSMLLSMNSVFEILFAVRRASSALIEAWIDGQRLRRAPAKIRGSREPQRFLRWTQAWILVSELKHFLSSCLLEHLANNSLSTEWNEMELKISKSKNLSEIKKIIKKNFAILTTKIFLRRSNFLREFTKIFAVCHALHDLISAAADKVSLEDSELLEQLPSSKDNSRIGSQSIYVSWTEKEESDWRLFETDLTLLADLFNGSKKAVKQLLEEELELEGRSLLHSHAEEILLRLNLFGRKETGNDMEETGTVSWDEYEDEKDDVDLYKDDDDGNDD